MAKKHASMFGSGFFKGIAHRGIHDSQCTENGLLAFKRAIDLGFAFELDVHLSSDGRLIVCHDSDLARTTGKPGLIERLTADEIRRDYRLLDGETVPTLQEVLGLNQERSLMVVELKTYEKNHKALARAAIEELASIKEKTGIVIISFDPRALLPMRKAGFARGLLVGREKKWTWILRPFFESVDLDKTLLGAKKVKRYARRHILNVWTIETPEELAETLRLADGITFQKIDPSLVRQALSAKR